VPTGGGPPACHSGSCIGVQMNGYYSNSLSWGVCTATSPVIDLSATSAPTLQFRAWVDTEGWSYDGGNLKVSTDGVTFNTVNSVTPAYNLTSVNNQVAWGGTTEPWAQQWYVFEADLSAYAGVATVYLRFDFRTDGSVTYPGWYIDELMILD
jgi:bacillopeptidase F (M6 metalloprotease family)